MIDSFVYRDNGYRITLRGVVTPDELVEANQRLLNDERFETSDYQLWSFAGVESLRFDADDIKRLAHDDQQHSNRNPRMRVAIVSDSALTFGIGRMYEGLYSDGPWRIGVFSSTEEALEWLGLEGPI